METKARVIALYLPQYHPIQENDMWWGKGFTEWTNVAKAKPLFKGHVQPRIPTELGFYDLRLPSVREQQAKLAREAGIEGFCYYHYWFGNGKKLLEKPFEEVVSLKEPDFPFCLCWANHSWRNSTWTSVKGNAVKQMLAEQLYPGEEDNLMHFNYLLDAFRDSRYIKVDGKLLFIIWNPFGFQKPNEFINQWQQLAKENGLPGFHFVAIVTTSTFKTFSPNGSDATKRIKQVLDMGFDAVSTDSRYRAQILSKNKMTQGFISFMNKKIGKSIPNVFNHSTINKNMYIKEDGMENVYPTILPNWDRTPRTATDAIYVNSTPEVFRECVENVCDIISHKEDEHKIIILKSWNEWGEGNYMEPDMQYGRGYIDALKSVLK